MSSNNPTVTPDQIKFYEENGFLVVPSFLSQPEVQSLKTEMVRLIKEGLKDQLDKERKKDFISGDISSYNSRIHLESQNQCHLFFESDAVKDGQLQVPVEQSCHKLGHGVQYHSPVVKDVIFSPKMSSLVKSLTRFINPVVIQAMFLAKPPKLGAKRDIHQDETYLITDPQGMVFGVWIALDDATETNGCLEFIPGSHKNFVPIKRLFHRTSALDGKGDVGNNNEDQKVVDYFGDAPYLHDEMIERFVRVPVKAGDLIFIHGLVVHKSEANRSAKSRNAFAFHCYEKIPSVRWHDQNQWLELDHDHRFIPLYI